MRKSFWLVGSFVGIVAVAMLSVVSTEASCVQSGRCTQADMHKSHCDCAINCGSETACNTCCKGQKSITEKLVAAAPKAGKAAAKSTILTNYNTCTLDCAIQNF